MATSVHTLLEKAQEAMEVKKSGSKAFSEKQYMDAVKAYERAREILDGAGVEGHHQAVLWSNEAICHLKTGDYERCQFACKKGLTHFTTDKVREKLQTNLEKSEKIPDPPTEEEQQNKEEQIKQAKEKMKRYKEEEKKQAVNTVQSDGGIYGNEGSGQKDYKVPGPLICSMEDAYKIDLGPPPPPRPWWEERDRDPDEPPPRKHITYLPAHLPPWLEKPSS